MSVFNDLLHSAGNRFSIYRFLLAYCHPISQNLFYHFKQLTWKSALIPSTFQVLHPVYILPTVRSTSKMKVVLSNIPSKRTYSPTEVTFPLTSTPPPPTPKKIRYFNGKN